MVLNLLQCTPFKTLYSFPSVPFTFQNSLQSSFVIAISCFNVSIAILENHKEPNMSEESADKPGWMQCFPKCKEFTQSL